VNTTSTPAERLDRAVDSLLAGDDPAARLAAGDPDMRRMLRAAAALHAALAPPPVSRRFEARLGARLADASRPGRGALPSPTRLLVVGAISSAAVGVGVTAYAFWRSTRGQALVHRLQR
jgi:hypothetical protein